MADDEQPEDELEEQPPPTMEERFTMIDQKLEDLQTLLEEVAERIREMDIYKEDRR